MKKIVSVLCGVAFGISAICAAAPEWALYGVENDSEFHDGVAVFIECIDGECKRGAIDTSGKIVIPAKFESLYDFENGMARASLDGKLDGIVNTKGQWLLEPKYSIYKEDDVPGAYKIEDENGKTGLFYNGRIVLPVEYKYVSVYNFPFVDYTVFSDEYESHSLNLVTGELYDFVHLEGDIYVAEQRNGKDRIKNYYKKNGEKISVSEYNVSSKGLTPFKDETTNKFGLKNARTGDIAVPAKYEDMYDIWINDVIIANDSVSPDNSRTSVLLSADGREVIADRTKYIQIWIEGNYAKVVVIPAGDSQSGLYDLNGNEILPVKYSSIFQQEPYGDWFVVNDGDEYKLYNAKWEKMYDSAGSYSDGMFPMGKEVNGEKIAYYLNAETGEIIDKGFETAWRFSESLAKVRFKGRKYYDIIDKKGNVVLYGSENCKFEGRYFSEGVISAEDDENNVYGYVYNPLGHGGYVYNQKGASDNAIERWRKMGHDEFDKKNYALAKDYYYQIMMTKPDDTNAIANYGTCLYNMGYYEEAIEAYTMALDINPDYTYAKGCLADAQEQLNKQMYEEEESEESANSGTFWDALGSFCSFLGQVTGAMSGSYENYNTFSSSYSGGSSMTSGGGNYQSQYDMWANRAEKNYNSLTNLGYSSKSKSGKRSGGTMQSMNSGTYVQMKKALRDAQREMRNIRQKARKAGVNIVQSHWETATVNY